MLLYSFPLLKGSVMRFGICTKLETADAVKEAGWDFVEENAQGLFRGLEGSWAGQVRAATAPLPIPAANTLVPGSLKITGPEVGMIDSRMGAPSAARARLQAATSAASSKPAGPTASVRIVGFER